MLGCLNSCWDPSPLCSEEQGCPPGPGSFQGGAEGTGVVCIGLSPELDALQENGRLFSIFLPSSGSGPEGPLPSAAAPKQWVF